MSTEPFPVTVLLVERALKLAAQGLPVFPCKADKKPCTKNGFKNATTDEVAIRELFATPGAALIGVPTGPVSGFDVLDIDPDGAPWYETNKQRLPPTEEHLTQRDGGRHLLFQHPPGEHVKSTTSQVAPGVDVRGNGGYIIWHDRAVTNKDVRAAWPAWLLEANNAKRKRGDGPIPNGKRNARLTSEAGRLRHYNEPDAKAWEKLCVFNREHCEHPVAERELKKIFDSIWQYPPGYVNTDMGNAERLLDKHGQDLRFVNESKRWLHWNGSRFVEDRTRKIERLMYRLMRDMHLAAVQMPDGDARKAALAWAKASESRDKIQAALAIAPGHGNLAVAQTALDADPWLLGTPNATINLEKTGRPVPALQSQLITKATNAHYDPAARCPLWMACLERWLPDAEARAFIKRFVGYSLTGVTNEQCLLLIFGESATGKRSFLQTLEYTWGDYAKRTPASTWLAKGRDAIPNDVAALAGARIAISTESERRANWAQALLKASTGQESLSARFMRGEWFTFLPQFKPMFGTNFLPGYDGSDRAMTRRLRPVRFDVVIPHNERDKSLQSKLQKEASGILNWAIEGCLEWQHDGLGEPASVIDAARDYAAANDQVALFIAECCETGEHHSEAGSKLHQAYVTWCKRHNEGSLAGRQFAEALEKRGFKKGKRTEALRPWLGLRLVKPQETTTDDDTPY